jgi:hypothetical protein
LDTVLTGDLIITDLGIGLLVLEIGVTITDTIIGVQAIIPMSLGIILISMAGITVIRMVIHTTLIRIMAIITITATIVAVVMLS